MPKKCYRIWKFSLILPNLCFIFLAKSKQILVEISDGNKNLIFLKYGHVPLSCKNMKSIRPIPTYVSHDDPGGHLLMDAEHRMNVSFKGTVHTVFNPRLLQKNDFILKSFEDTKLQKVVGVHLYAIYII